jgi:hypothetical protein
MIENTVEILVGDEVDLIPLSASRVKTLKGCTWEYFCNYVLKLPDSSNDGAKRGSVTHYTLEALSQKKENKDGEMIFKHDHHIEKIIEEGSYKVSKAVKRLVEIHARREGVDDPENMKLIDKFIQHGIIYNFRGGLDNGDQPDIDATEKKFDITVNENGKRYRMLGFIDRHFVYKKHSYIIIRDYKTSKDTFSGSDLTDNIQAKFYLLAARHLYPELKHRSMEFTFLKFHPTHKKGILTVNTVSNEELDGFEYFLTSVNEYLEDFGVDKAKSSFAGHKGIPKTGGFEGLLKCGKHYKIKNKQPLLNSEGKLVRGYMCNCRKPMKYKHLLDEEGSVVSRHFEDENPEVPKGHTLEEKEYEYQGCPIWIERDAAELIDIRYNKGLSFEDE